VSRSARPQAVPGPAPAVHAPQEKMVALIDEVLLVTPPEASRSSRVTAASRGTALAEEAACMKGPPTLLTREPRSRPEVTYPVDIVNFREHGCADKVNLLGYFPSGPQYERRVQRDESRPVPRHVWPKVTPRESPQRGFQGFRPGTSSSINRAFERGAGREWRHRHDDRVSRPAPEEQANALLIHSASSERRRQPVMGGFPRPVQVQWACRNTTESKTRSRCGWRR